MKHPVLKIGAAALCWLASGGVWALTAEEVLGKMDEAEFGPKDTVAEVKMMLEDKDGNTSERKLKMYQKGSEKRLIKFTSPAEVKGIGFLDIGDDKMYLYLPAFRKIRRIAGHVKNENFAGTDFSHEDLSTKRFSQRLQATGMTEQAEHFVLDTRPKPDEFSQYHRLMMWVRKKDFLFDRVEYFDKTGEKTKVFVRKEFRPAGKYVQSYWAEMSDLNKRHTSRMIVESLRCDTGLKDRVFSKRMLKRL